MRPDSSSIGRVLSFLEQIRGRHVAVLGDVMLDVYLEGESERISPEAPIPIVVERSRSVRLGGAGNVASSCAALGASVSLHGVVGADEEGKAFRTLCEEARIDAKGVRSVLDRPTTRKTRVVARGHQVLRIDRESRNPVSADVVAALIDEISSDSTVEILILSDYAKGVLEPDVISAAIALGDKRGIAVFVDPVRSALDLYRGAHCLSPNRSTFEAALGRRLSSDLSELPDAAREMRRKIGVRQLVVTLGADGMLIVDSSDEVERLKALRHEVCDVTGAGDTVIATLSMGRLAGVSLLESARLANAAASIVVGRVGATPVGPADLISVLEPSSAAKRVNRDDLRRRREAWRLLGRRIVFTNGCFDLLHPGHLELLRKAAELGDELVVALNSDASIRRLKGPGRPVLPELDRVAMLEALACVSAVVVFEEETPLNLIRELLPDVLVKGADYEKEEIVGRTTVEENGGRVVRIELVPDRSTTSLIARIRSEVDTK